MAATDGQIILAASRFGDTNTTQPVLLRDFSKQKLPAVAKIVKGQHQGLGVPSLAAPSLQSTALFLTAGKKYQILAQPIKLKEGRKPINVGVKILIPESYSGYFELLSEDGRSTRCIESVLELSKRRNCKVLVRETFRCPQMNRTIHAGELLTTINECGKYLQCKNVEDAIINLPLDAKAKFSPIAREDSISGVHTVKNLLLKRMPLVVRLVHGSVPKGLKQQFVSEMRLLGCVEVDRIFALPLQKDQELVPVPLNAKLKLQRAKNMEQLEHFIEYIRFREKAERLLSDARDRLQTIDIKINEGKDKKDSSRFLHGGNNHHHSHHLLSSGNGGGRHRLPVVMLPSAAGVAYVANGLMENGYILKRSGSCDSYGKNLTPLNEKISEEYNDIDHIYDYVRGLMPLSKSVSRIESTSPSSPGIETSPQLQNGANAISPTTASGKNAYTDSSSTYCSLVRINRKSSNGGVTGGVVSTNHHTPPVPPFVSHNHNHNNHHHHHQHHHHQQHNHHHMQHHSQHNYKQQNQHQHKDSHLNSNSNLSNITNSNSSRHTNNSNSSNYYSSLEPNQRQEDLHNHHQQRHHNNRHNNHILSTNTNSNLSPSHQTTVSGGIVVNHYQHHHVEEDIKPIPPPIETIPGKKQPEKIQRPPLPKLYLKNSYSSSAVNSNSNGNGSAGGDKGDRRSGSGGSSGSASSARVLLPLHHYPNQHQHQHQNQHQHQHHHNQQQQQSNQHRGNGSSRHHHQHPGAVTVAQTAIATVTAVISGSSGGSGGSSGSSKTGVGTSKDYNLEPQSPLFHIRYKSLSSLQLSPTENIPSTAATTTVTPISQQHQQQQLNTNHKGHGSVGVNCKINNNNNVNIITNNNSSVVASHLMLLPLPLPLPLPHNNNSNNNNNNNNINTAHIGSPNVSSVHQLQSPVAPPREGTLDSSRSGGRTSGDSSNKLPEKKTRRLSRPRSLSNLVWNLRPTKEKSSKKKMYIHHFDHRQQAVLYF